MFAAPSPGPFPPTFPPSSHDGPGDWVWAGAANVWSFLTTYSGTIAGLAAVVTAYIAIRALLSASNDSRERSRPVVLALFRVARHSDTSFDFVVRNYGASSARDVRVVFDPPISESDREEVTTKQLALRYDEPIPLLPPGSEITNVYWSGTDRGGEKLVNRLNTPTKVSVTITYRGAGKEEYREVIPLNADWTGLQTTSQSSSSTPGRMAQIATSLRKIADEMPKSRRELHDIASTLDGATPGQEPDSPAVPMNDFGAVQRALGGVILPPENDPGDGAVPEAEMETPVDGGRTGSAHVDPDDVV